MTKSTQALAEAQAITGKLRRHQRILVDLGRLAAQKLDLDGFLAQAIAQVARAVEIDHVKVLRHRAERADLLMVAGTGWKPGVVGHARFPTDFASAPGRAYQTGEPVTVDNLAHTPDLKPSPTLTEHGIVALANVSVPVDGTSWGVLEVDSTVPRDFSADTVQFLTATANLIGAVVHRDQIMRAEAERLAAAAAETKAQAVLLTEMQHRVKNNLQIILAIVAMQKRRLPQEAAQRALDHIANRITAISLAHDQLNPVQSAGGARTVNLASYLEALCAAIQQQHEGTVSIAIEADDIDLLIDRAVPLGLCVNESVVNAVKHAFGADDTSGRIMVRLTAGIGRGEARLTVADNGRGIDPERPKGSGTRLIQSLAAQIGGTVETASSDEGTTTTVEFPVVT
ncbi:sensor histidine kinase [Methylobacterium iners]|uniref:histidine kinase n=1 Tax=Methylobacterium iners TaxID=418707 RepID=A0ABQ4RYI8_9HYPH|nr:histidine kinase dimerization/phosphoacceptor domain -containing protein [Methylobacterium iners]GJD95874.1 hypothetical protein OCOJLMKI_3090 [Methylobacterium iners]